MKSRLTALILTLTILLSIFVVAIPIASATEVTLTLSDAELFNQFAKFWGPGTLTAKTDILGLGVQFNFTGLSSSGTMLGDQFPVSQLAGGAPDNIGGWGNFQAYTQYRLAFTNVGPNPVTVQIDINTGWTGSPGTPARDTYWENTWTYLGVGESKVLTLDFSCATCWNAHDDTVPEWRYPGGTTGVVVRRLSEVSQIGFQVCGNGAGSIVVSATTPSDVVLTLSDAELSTQFAKETGPATLTAVTDIPGPGVRFDFTGLSSSTGTVVGDNFPVSGLAGGAWKDYGSGFAGPYDFSGYARYVLLFNNVGTTTVKINLKINTGWTNPPWGSSARDTFWQNGWTNIPPGESRVATLDFWSAEVWHAGDDPVPEWQYSDGTSGVIVRRLDEVSDIGFQILGASDGSIVVSGETILTLSDAELSTEFAKETGPGTLTAVTDILGPGVKFDFTGLRTDVGTVVGDNFQVSPLAGGTYKTYGVNQTFSTWGDFSGYTKYRMTFINIGPNPVTVNLKMNTGWTIPPPEYAKAWRDTYWQDSWTYIAQGTSQIVTLDFSSAEIWNAGDEQEYTPHPDGTTGVAVWRLDEVSDIGFQILADGNASIILTPEVVHDVAITDVASSPQQVAQGNLVTVNVTTANLGNIPESFTVTAYYDDNAVGSQPVNNLDPSTSIILTFNWNTSGVPLGNYTISANATQVPSETNVVNNGFIDGTVEIISGVIHDISIINVTTSTPKVCPGRRVNITVVVKNNGEVSETFNVTAYRDSIPIGTIPVTNLGVGENTTIIFQWNTSGLVPCHTWTIKAEAPLDGDTNQSDNSFTDGTVKIRMLEDINGDGVINILDILEVAVAFGSESGWPNWNSDADLDSNGIINILDLVKIAVKFGETCP